MESARNAVPPPDPADAQTVAQFVERMRQLKAWSGLSFRDLERQARRNGEHLPYSTAAGALSRYQLPREDLLHAFVTACGCEEETVATWVDVRRALVVREIAADSDAAGPLGAEGSPETEGRPPGIRTGRGARVRRPRAIAVTGGVLLVASLVAALQVFTGWPFPVSPEPGAGAAASRGPQSRIPASPAPSPPVAPGAYRIRFAHSDQCLSELENSSGRIHQRPCAEAFPPMTVRLEPGNIYRITADHPTEGPGCMGIRNASTDAGPLVYDDFCGEGGANQGGERYRFERVTSPIAGFRIRPVHNKLCLGIPRDSREERAVVFQLSCDSASPSQVFLFDPR